jgi:hypothetical protein
VSYAVQLNDGGGFRTVGDDFRFRSGDRFRLIVKTSFPGHLYAFHLDRATGKVDVLLSGARATVVDQEVLVPAEGGMTMDRNPGPEEFTLIASARPIEKLEFASDSIGGDTFRDIVMGLSKAAGNGQARADGDWRKVEGDKKEDMVLRTTFTLRHD